MKNGWTGGQYSVFRILMGAYFGSLFLWVILETARTRESDPWMFLMETAGPFNIFALWPHLYFALFILNVGAVFAALVAVGICDRIAALGCGYIWVCLTIDYSPYVLVALAPGRCDQLIILLETLGQPHPGAPAQSRRYCRRGRRRAFADKGFL